MRTFAADRPARSVRLQAMVTPEEEKIIQRVAEARGWTISEYLRASALMCSSIDGDTAALRLVGRNFVSAVSEAFSRKNVLDAAFAIEKGYGRSEAKAKSPNR